jgi:mono/diheme cytochrome c family protein
MNNKRNYIKILFTIALPLFFYSCQQPKGNSTGSEYIPDMAHSTAMEANVYTYYYWNTWDDESVVKLKDISMPRDPVAGTIPRGYAGVHYAPTTTAKNAVLSNLNGDGAVQAISVPINGSVPYYYGNTEEERTRAMEEIIYNPYPISDDGIAKSKDLYNIYCGICHGENGDGNGYLVRDDGGVYPAAPANFLTDVFINSSNGRYYHAIMYGKNVMGGYADKLSYEERWQVIHYIRSLQAKEKKLVYNEKENTLNDIDIPGNVKVSIASNEAISEGETATDESEVVPDNESSQDSGGH